MVASQVSLKGRAMVDPDGVVVIVFFLHQWAGEAHRFDSARCNTFFITHTSCDTNWSQKWRHAMPSELKISNGSTRQSHQVRHGRHNFLNNSFNEIFIKIGLGTNDLNLIIQLCAEAFFFQRFVLECYSKICVCNAFCHFYHVTLDETLWALPYMIAVCGSVSPRSQSMPAIIAIRMIL